MKFEEMAELFVDSVFDWHGITIKETERGEKYGVYAETDCDGACDD